MIRVALATLLLVAVTACSDGSPPPRAEVLTPAAPPADQTTAAASPTPSAAAPVDLEPEPPLADPFDLARRLRGIDLPPTALTQPPAAQTGDSRTFSVYDLEANRPQEVSASLIVKSEHADFWVQDGQKANRSDFEKAAQQFETSIYPDVTRAFGLPAPAADGSPGRISVLHLNLRGAGGYFSASDQLPRRIAPYSNEQQIVYLDLRAATPGGSGYAGLLAHEFQHLVNQQLNPAAESWFNEGLSEVANELLGGGNAFLRRFETAPDTQLNDWPPGGNTAAHYGAGHSFLRYLLRRHGGLDRAAALTATRSTGVNSVERYLRTGGFGVGFLDVFADWTVANLLDEPGEGRFSQPDIDHRVRNIAKLPASGSGDDSVHQFGTRYLQVEPDGRDLTLRFDGAEQIARVQAQPVSGKGLWWSNRADSMNSTLTRELDLTGVRAATLRFKLWYDIEQDYDFAYVTASRDGGRTWQILRGRQASDRDPLKIAYGPAYSGRGGGGATAGWLDEQIDLTPYAGGRLLLRFEYVTDEATHAEGMAIDDLAIAEIGWSDNAESPSSWQASGFLHVAEPLPQRYIVQLVEEDERSATTVRRIDLDAAADATIQIPRTTRKATLIVSGATLGATAPATFRWQTSP